MHLKYNYASWRCLLCALFVVVYMFITGFLLIYKYSVKCLSMALLVHFATCLILVFVYKELPLIIIFFGWDGNLESWLWVEQKEPETLRHRTWFELFTPHSPLRQARHLEFIFNRFSWGPLRPVDFPPALRVPVYGLSSNDAHDWVILCPIQLHFSPLFGWLNNVSSGEGILRPLM